MGGARPEALPCVDALQAAETRVQVLVLRCAARVRAARTTAEREEEEVGNFVKDLLGTAVVVVFPKLLEEEVR